MSAVSTAFDDLCTGFRIDGKIREWLTSETGLACTSLADFQFAITSTEAAEAVADANGITDGAKMLQVSRIKQAVKSLEDARRQAEAIKTKGIDEADLDTMLVQSELDSLEDAFWVCDAFPPPSPPPAHVLTEALLEDLPPRLGGEPPFQQRLRY